MQSKAAIKRHRLIKPTKAVRPERGLLDNAGPNERILFCNVRGLGRTGRKNMREALLTLRYAMERTGLPSIDISVERLGDYDPCLAGLWFVRFGMPKQDMTTGRNTSYNSTAFYAVSQTVRETLRTYSVPYADHWTSL